MCGCPKVLQAPKNKGKQRERYARMAHCQQAARAGEHGREGKATRWHDSSPNHVAFPPCPCSLACGMQGADCTPPMPARTHLTLLQVDGVELHIRIVIREASHPVRHLAAAEAPGLGVGGQVGGRESRQCRVEQRLRRCLVARERKRKNAANNLRAWRASMYKAGCDKSTVAASLSPAPTREQ